MMNETKAKAKQKKQGKSFVKQLAVAVVAAFTTAAFAQPQSDVQIEIEEVIVTAQKREQRAIDVPMSITAVGGKVLEDLGIDNALGLSYRVPGLVVQEAVPGSQLYTLRGVGNAVGAFALVGVYLDEVDVVSANPSGQYDLSLYDLARVEVLRGPQGTLYGAGSVGGTIRLITNKPQLDRFGGKGEMSVFDQERGSTGYEFKAALNIPVVEDVFGLRFALNYHDWGGWIDQPAANREDFNDNEMANARVRALWQLNDHFDINGTLIVHRNEGGGMNIVNLRPNSKSLYQSFIDPALETPYVDDYNHYNITAVYDFDSFSLTSATGFTDTERYVAGARRFIFESELVPGFPGSDVYEANGRDEIGSKVLTQELRMDSKGDGALNWTVGLFYRDEDESVDSLGTRALGGTVISLDVPYSQAVDNKSWSVFGDISYAINDRWELGAGARYFKENQFFSDLTYNTHQRASFDHLSPRVYLSFGVTEDINVYASLAQGFRSGGFNAVIVETVGGPGTYGPEEVTSFELGTKMSLADGRLYTELAVFYSEYTDMQAWTTMPIVMVEMISNIGKAEIKGFEWSFAWQPTEKLALGFNGSIIDAVVVDIGEGGMSHLPGDPLDQVADYGWSVFADYYFSWSADRPGFFHAGYNRQGPIHMTSRDLGLVQPVGVSNTLGFLYASIGVKIGRTSVELFGRNLLDEDGISNPYEHGSIETQPRPRVIGIRVAFDF
jgi:iron complex outermembrane receptor protein